MLVAARKSDGVSSHWKRNGNKVTLICMWGKQNAVGGSMPSACAHCNLPHVETCLVHVCCPIIPSVACYFGSWMCVWVCMCVRERGTFLNGCGIRCTGWKLFFALPTHYSSLPSMEKPQLHVYVHMCIDASLNCNVIMSKDQSWALFLVPATQKGFCVGYVLLNLSSQDSPTLQLYRFHINFV